MKYTLMILILVIASGCATPRTKWSDKNMRVMIDPDAIDDDNYLEVFKAVTETEKFTVVDRQAGFKAIKKEQERLHQEDPDRYANKEKWAHWGKLYGVGAVIVPQTRCTLDRSTFNQFKRYNNCKQYLWLVDANTGEVVVIASGENEGRSTFDLPAPAPTWEDTVEKLISKYPKYFDTKEYHEKIIQYQEESEKLAKERMGQ